LKETALPADTYTQNELQLSITTPLGADVLLLQGFTGAEALSQPFLFTLELLSEDDKVDFAKLIGKPSY
jgi:type VI secretion system secreted protein VgrG